jgi:phospholipase A1/A2
MKIDFKTEVFTVYKLVNACRLGIALALLSCGGFAHASDALAECTSIASDRERLACFDRVAGTPSAVKVAVAPVAPAKRSMIDEAWGFGPDAPRYPLRYYRPNYILPVSYTDDVNQEPFSPLFDAAASDQKLNDTEARFQLSFKNRVWTTDDRRWGLWVAYTQQSQWQVYSDDISRPFRETNYQPEVFVSFRPDVQLGEFRWGLLNFGYNHQSNGRSQILSRSWDRLFVEAAVERGDFALLGRAWYRMHESSDEDDNPDITDYMGYSELTALYRHDGHSLTVMGRGNWNTGKGAIQLAWTTPPLLGPLRGYLRLFSGYGDSMIDYNWNQNIVGIGVALNDVL